MYFITCIEKLELDSTGFCDSGEIRCMGYYTSLKDAIDSAHENNADIRECLFDYVVIEEVEEGLYPMIISELWFKWDEEKKGFYEIKKPKCTEHICNWSIG